MFEVNNSETRTTSDGVLVLSFLWLLKQSAYHSCMRVTVKLWTFICQFRWGGNFKVSFLSRKLFRESLNEAISLVEIGDTFNVTSNLVNGIASFRFSWKIFLKTISGKNTLTLTLLCCPRGISRNYILIIRNRFDFQSSVWNKKCRTMRWPSYYYEYCHIFIMTSFGIWLWDCLMDSNTTFTNTTYSFQLYWKSWLWHWCFLLSFSEYIRTASL